MRAILLMFLASGTIVVPRASGSPPDGALRIEFLTPASWRCVSEQSCTLCHDLDGAPADVLVWEGPAPMRRSVPPGAALRVCAPPDAVARDFPLRSPARGS
jgi:hypothetical protein